jgi:hypothetical protein
LGTISAFAIRHRETTTTTTIIIITPYTADTKRN